MFHAIKRHDSLARRVSFLALTGVVLTIFLTGALIFWHYTQSQERTLTSYLSAYIDTLVAATYIDENQTVQVYDDIRFFENMPFYWQITTPNRPLKKSPLLDQWIPSIAHENAITTETINDVPLMVISKDFHFPNNQTVTYLLGIQTEIIEPLLIKERAYLLEEVWAWLILLALALIAAIAYIQVRAITRPLHTITHNIAAIHSGNRDALDEDFPKELNLLAKEINTLIRYSNNIVERYRNFSSNLSHSLKTPLTILNNEAHTTKGPLAQTVKEQTSEMLNVIDRNLSRNQGTPNNHIHSKAINVIPIIEQTVRGFSKLHDRVIDFVPPKEPCIFNGNETDFYEIVGNLIENACKYSHTHIAINIYQKNHELHFIVEDDGPGIPQSNWKTVTTRGMRLDEQKPGSGIGLSVVHDIVTLYNGTITLGTSKLGGLKAHIHFVRHKL